MSKLWKCWNCQCEKTGKPGHDFTAAVPVCPRCTLDGRTDEGRSYVVQRTVIHWEPPHPIIKAKGTGKRVCDGKPARSGVASGATSAVNCPACRAKAEFAIARDIEGDPSVPGDADFPIERDPVNDEPPAAA